MYNPLWVAITTHISQTTGEVFTDSLQRPVSGGCINQGYQLTDGRRSFFVKLNEPTQGAMFEAEALGLKQMLATQAIRVPQPICWGVNEGAAYLVLEWLDLGRGDSQAWYALGQHLAAMHRWATQIPGTGFRYGWDRQNTIGSSPQINSWATSWADFFTQQRIGYQFRLAGHRQGYFPRHQELMAALPQLLADRQPPPAIVHGDLWSGNAAITQTGEPVIFDPAVYWGDREVDLAMTELFGGFPAEFYQGYRDSYPLDEGYPRRKTIYNLYHILNHFNLFGGGYAAQANRMIDQILR